MCLLRRRTYTRRREREQADETLDAAFALLTTRVDGQEDKASTFERTLGRLGADAKAFRLRSVQHLDEELGRIRAIPLAAA